jgi:hypothetical protein
VEGSGEQRKSPYLIYFFWSCLTHKQSEFVSNFQPSLATRARLKSCILLKPRPPLSFGEQMELQDFNDKFLNLSLGKPHQKFLKSLSKEEETEIGRRKELIAYEGIVEATDLMSIVRPACDKVFACQPSILPETFSNISVKVTVLDLPKRRGKPKYFEEFKALVKGKMARIL